MNTNPCLLPEIVHRLGTFIPLWKMYPVPTKDAALEFYPHFYPQALVRCIQVCRLWRETLTPFLWAVIDATDVHKIIPSEVVEAHSQHVRYLSLTDPWPTLTQRLTLLRHLLVSGEVLQSCNSLLYANRLCLTSLTLTDMNDETVDNDSLPPVNLPQLTHLQLDNSYLDNVDQIARFVNANTQLEDLSLIWVEQWTSFAEWHDFPHLTQLTINSDLDTNPAVVHLVRHCPALKTLVHAPFESNMFSTLTKNLRECCPAFTSIQCISVEEVLFSGESMSDYDYVLLMQASARIVHMELAVSNFQLDLGDQLAGLHGNWLETVALTMVTGTAFSFSSASKILQKCPALVSFSLSHLHETQSSDANASLFLTPWQCPKLERIKLQSCVCSTRSALHSESSDEVTTGQTSRGTLDGTSGLARAPDSDRDLEFLQKISQHGWRFDRDLRMVAEEMLEVEEVWALRDRVFERLLELPRMCSISIEGYEYSRRV